MQVSALQGEVSAYLEDYEARILSLRQEMDDHRDSMVAFKEDLHLAELRCVDIQETQPCEYCLDPARSKEFFVFPCGHCFHEACLKALVPPALDEARREAFFLLESRIVDHQAAVATGDGPGRLSPDELASLQEQLADILADD